jgi:hypothetical protein
VRNTIATGRLIVAVTSTSTERNFDVENTS